MGGGGVVVGSKMDTTATIEYVYTCLLVVQQPPTHHERMAHAPIFTAAAPKLRDSSSDKKWLNCVSYTTAREYRRE